jgi:hypothetical protein
VRNQQTEREIELNWERFYATNDDSIKDPGNSVAVELKEVNSDTAIQVPDPTPSIRQLEA